MGKLNSKNLKWVGTFIRTRREVVGLSQRALGLVFEPPVTTQFISNIERGVTPLPPHHVPTLAKALMVNESELMTLLEREYAAKLSGRISGNPDEKGSDERAAVSIPTGLTQLVVPPGDFDFMRKLCDSYRQADQKTRQALISVCESLFKWSAQSSDSAKSSSQEDSVTGRSQSG